MKAKNRVREFRKAAGLTQVKLGDMIRLSHSQVQRIESGKRGISVPVLERLSVALNKSIEEILGVPAAPNSTSHRYVTSGFKEDAVPYVESEGGRLRVQPRKGENIDPWLITTDAAERAGVKSGQVRFVDISIEAVENVKPLQCVIAQIYGGGPEGKTITVVRQFVPPSLLITNSDTVNEMPLDIDKGEAYIKGVILEDFVAKG